MRDKDELPATFAELTKKDTDGEVVKMPEKLIKLLELAGLTPEKVCDIFRRMTLHWKNFFPIHMAEDEYENGHQWAPKFDPIKIELGNGDSIQIDGVLKRIYDFFEPWLDDDVPYNYYDNSIYAPLLKASMDTIFDARFDEDVMDAIVAPLLEHYEEIQNVHIDSAKLTEVFREGLEARSPSMATKYSKALSSNKERDESYRELRSSIRDLLHDESFLEKISNCYYVD